LLKAAESECGIGTPACTLFFCMMSLPSVHGTKLMNAFNSKFGFLVFVLLQLIAGRYYMNRQEQWCRSCWYSGSKLTPKAFICQKFGQNLKKFSKEASTFNYNNEIILPCC